MEHTMRSGYLICFFIVACALAASAQTGGAAPPSRFQQYTISGFVVDQSNRRVGGAEVTLIDPETNFRAQPVMTNATGEFAISELTASTYLLQAMKGRLTSDPAQVAVGPGAPRPSVTLLVK
jgi:hypothetical protein